MGGWRVAKPLWLSRVFRTVGLTGDGEIGVRGRGDFSAWLVDFVGTARASLGRAARDSMMVV